ncbi:caskin-1-like [Choloepus didactylus]|uniref:caskin-1-like n=1 Tax=Choloepus didactylus TaxID=27675 RepID=UPI00189FB53D|nr:caskin-1-like [Choloepus didactylus]
MVSAVAMPPHCSLHPLPPLPALWAAEARAPGLLVAPEDSLCSLWEPLGPPPPFWLCVWLRPLDPGVAQWGLEGGTQGRGASQPAPHVSPEAPGPTSWGRGRAVTSFQPMASGARRVVQSPRVMGRARARGSPGARQGPGAPRRLSAHSLPCSGASPGRELPAAPARSRAEPGRRLLWPDMPPPGSLPVLSLHRVPAETLAKLKDRFWKRPQCPAPPPPRSTQAAP